MDAATLSRQVESIAASMRLLLAPGQIVEVRALHPFASRVFATAEAGAIERLAEFAARQSGKSKGVYFTPNPLRSVRLSGKQNTALDTDVERRRWLLVDADPHRPKDTNSTDAEHAAALAVVCRVRCALASLDIRDVILGDSGNGAHLLARVDQPNDDAARVSQRRLLLKLHERFSTDAVEIDATTHNAARIWKVPGTLAAKGPHTSERPHRYARLLEMP